MNWCRGKNCSVQVIGYAYCPKCRKRQHRERHPIRTYYNDWKSSTKGRGIPFSISLEWFVSFCLRTNYISLKGRGKEDMTLDRIKIVWPDGTVRGYDEENIQMISKTANNKKQTQDQKDKYEALKSEIAKGDPDCPF